MKRTASVLTGALVKQAAMPEYTLRPNPNDSSQLVPFENDRGNQRWASQDEFKLYQRLLANKDQRAVDKLRREQGYGEQHFDPGVADNAPAGAAHPVSYVRGSVFGDSPGDLPDQTPRVMDRGRSIEVSNEEYDRMQRIARRSADRRRQAQNARQAAGKEQVAAAQLREQDSMRQKLTDAEGRNAQQAGQMAYYASRGMQTPKMVQQAGQSVARAIAPWFKKQKSGVTSNAPIKPPAQGVSSNRKPGQTGAGQA